MAFEIQETHELMGVVSNFPPVPSFWLDRFFPASHFSDSEWIDFEEVTKGRRLAPFVAPNVQGQPVLSRQQSIKRFKPAYLKPKSPVDPARLIRRRAGESLGGSMTMQEREDAIVADILADHDEMIRRRWEWMASEAVQKGMITISGDNYPTRTVGFGRKAANTATLSGAARWSTGTANPLNDIRGWARNILDSGTIATDLIMGTDASGYFFQNDEVSDAVETRRGSQTTLEKYNVSGSPVVYHGTLPGGVALWTYNDIYEDNEGNQVPFMDSEDVVIAGSVDGVRAFGAIQDRKANWAPVAIFPKMWEQEDPSGLFIMTQSAPLMITGRPNGAMKVSVNG